MPGKQAGYRDEGRPPRTRQNQPVARQAKGLTEARNPVAVQDPTGHVVKGSSVLPVVVSSVWMKAWACDSVPMRLFLPVLTERNLDGAAQCGADPADRNRQSLLVPGGPPLPGQNRQHARQGPQHCVWRALTCEAPLGHPRAKPP